MAFSTFEFLIQALTLADCKSDFMVNPGGVGIGTDLQGIQCFMAVRNVLDQWLQNSSISSETEASGRSLSSS